MNKVYYYNFKNGEVNLTDCKLRNEEIKSTTNAKLKLQKYYAWKVLEYAIKNDFNLNPLDVDFTKNANGKWKCSNFHFSISHSENAVCVSISTKQTGVDVQVKQKSFINGFEKSILIYCKVFTTYAVLAIPYFETILTHFPETGRI